MYTAHIVAIMGITNYLVHRISAYTCEHFKNYETFEALGHFKKQQKVSDRVGV